MSCTPGQCGHLSTVDLTVARVVSDDTEAERDLAKLSINKGASGFSGHEKLRHRGDGSQHWYLAKPAVQPFCSR